VNFSHFVVNLSLFPVDNFPFFGLAAIVNLSQFVVNLSPFIVNLSQFVVNLSHLSLQQFEIKNEIRPEHEEHEVNTRTQPDLWKTRPSRKQRHRKKGVRFAHDHF